MNIIGKITGGKDSKGNRLSRREDRRRGSFEVADVASGWQSRSATDSTSAARLAMLPRRQVITSSSRRSIMPAESGWQIYSSSGRHLNSLDLARTTARSSILPPEVSQDFQQKIEEIQSLNEANRVLHEDIHGVNHILDDTRRQLRISHAELEAQCQKNEALRLNFDEAENGFKRLSQQHSQGQESLRRAQNTTKHYEEEIKKLNKKIEGFKSREINFQEQQRKDAKTKESLESDLAHSREKVSNKEEILQAQSESIRELETQLERFRVSQEQQAEEVRKAQESAFQMRLEPGQGQWMPDADNDVSNKFNSLSGEMRAWCKNFASKSPMGLEILLPDDQDRVKRILLRVAQHIGGNCLVDIEDKKLGSRIPGMLLFAILTTELFDTIFNNPFFFEENALELAESASSVKDETTAVLQKLYADICKVDKAGANTWRSQTLRLLDPLVASGNTSDAANQEARQLRVTAARNFSKNFIDGDASVLFDSEKSAEDRKRQLDDIATRAAEVSYRLWTQKTQLSSIGLEGLGSINGVVRFQSGSDIMEPHWIHIRQFENDERSLDGKRVAGVAHPAVVAFGDLEGKDYSKRKVWKKAIVWME